MPQKTPKITDLTDALVVGATLVAVISGCIELSNIYKTPYEQSPQRELRQINSEPIYNLTNYAPRVASP